MEKFQIEKVLLWSLVIFGFILIAQGARYLTGFIALDNAQNELTGFVLSSHANQIFELQLASNALLAENVAVSQKLEEEKAKRMTAEVTQKADASRLAQLAKDLEESQSPDLAVIVSAWRPRVAVLKCQWLAPTYEATSSGSAVLIPGTSKRGGVALLTNKHVVDYQGTLPSSCFVQFPSSNTNYPISTFDISVSSITDSAVVEINSPGFDLIGLNNSGLGRCTVGGEVGDEIVILGYPSIGSRSDITATEGIISGYESGYYLSSAKVEKGNSGGAAILAKNNCYLGIPSFVDVGQIESLARILDQELIK
ncbi:MAG: hypothetical protein COU10_02640 [Candidatus Harrisonbacteria bacterium CG10_big_fil_rev_8_21_14_0_10_45_28]|uniref:Serine protease n=1 Tax=Candidatus Harrisonbacteria bacterium CG10_big_fil_rev_8_21_14_0_10_45_28 TaxID=1974586 RepID=A0A2H0UN25_9BACT|nr:MAG: hypothetical protein COU10_02640 [Candidatus Harrisonbacteria bacterium CG10_big_fil_rev_8_21_14_0_10_45_28]